MNRLNDKCGHQAMDYRYRARHSLGNYDFPIIEETHDGKVKLYDPSLEFETPEVFFGRGLDSDGMERELGALLRGLSQTNGTP